VAENESKSAYDKVPSVHKGEVYHSDMAEAILRVRSFLTLSDTKQVLWYDNSAGIYKFNGEAIIEQFAQIWLGRLGLEAKATTHYIQEVTDYIRRDTYVDREKLNSNHNIMVVKNGTIELNTGTMLKHSKDFMSTIAIPVVYDASAKCPRIDKFISEVVEEKNIPLMYEIPAWCMMPYSNIERLVIFIGGGWNGKTTYMRMLTEFLGRDNCKAYSMQTLTTNRFAIAGLYGKLANIHDDLPSTILRQMSALKMLSGGSIVESEKKFKDSFSFVNTAKLIFTANQPPEITEDTLAIWRRFIIVDFPFEFSGEAENKNLLNEITTERELSGLLNKVLDSLLRLKKSGDFSYSTSVEETRSKYLLISNPTETFIEEHCEFDSFAKVAKEELYQAYTEFCQENKLPGLAKKAFGHKIKRTYTLGEERVTWVGIKLKE